VNFLDIHATSCLQNTGSARWDEKKEDGWKDRMDDWKMQQGNLGPEQDDIDPDMAMCVRLDLRFQAFLKTTFFFQCFHVFNVPKS
jgi:hypothetical protein